jgi:hypothetical protein
VKFLHQIYIERVTIFSCAFLSCVQILFENYISPTETTEHESVLFGIVWTVLFELFVERWMFSDFVRVQHMLTNDFSYVALCSPFVSPAER